MKATKKICEICGEKFTTKRSRQKRCGKDICQDVGFRISHFLSSRKRLKETLSEAEKKGIDVKKLKEKIQL